MPDHRLTRSVLAILAAVAMIVSAPIHAEHGHEASSPSATMHASCAICQVQAPVGTGVSAPVTIFEPSCTGRLVAAEAPARPVESRGGTDACRAPPALLA